MSTVYVRWYGQVLQGEVVENKEEGLLAGMVAVRIPLDGHHPIALFTSGNVYESVEKMQEVAKEVYSYPKEFPKPEDIIHSNLPCSYPADDYINLELFKRDNWDHEHNHLRTDKLDEFYQLWRTVMRPARFADPIIKPIKIERNINELADEFMNYDGVIYNPNADIIKMSPAEASVTLPSHKENPVSQALSKKVLQSAGEQKYKDSTQLSIFD